MTISYLDSELLAAHLLGFKNDEDYDVGQVEEKLYETYNIGIDDFHKLISDLAPLCEVGRSALTDKAYRGFADIPASCFIAKVEV